MNARQPDLDRVLRVFLADGPLEAPDRTIEAVVDAIATTRQERHRRRQWRFDMTSRIRLAITVAALVIALAAAAVYVGGSPRPSPLPSAGASALASPASSSQPSIAPSAAAGADPLLGAGVKAVNRVVAAATTLQNDGQLSANDAGRIVAAADGIRLSLGDGSLALGRTGFASLQTLLLEKAGPLSGAKADELRAAVTALGGVLQASPLVVGTLPAGSYASGTFHRPMIVLTLPAGWSRRLDDGEVFSIATGNVVLAFHHAATAATPAAMAAAVGVADTSGFDVTPSAVTYGLVSGYEGQSPANATLYYDAALNAYDPPPNSTVRIWVLDVDGRPLTIELIGPPADVAASLPDVKQIVRTLVAYQVPGG